MLSIKQGIPISNDFPYMGFGSTHVKGIVSQNRLRTIVEHFMQAGT